MPSPPERISGGTKSAFERHFERNSKASSATSARRSQTSQTRLEERGSTGGAGSIRTSGYLHSENI